MLFGLPQLTRPLRASLSLKPVLKWTLVSTLLFVGAVVGTALVAANAEGDRASLSDEATAAAVLGRPLPAIRSVDLALNRSGIGIDSVTSPHRAVHVSYAIGSTNIALLTVQRGNIQPIDTEETLQLGANTVSVASHAVRDGSTDVGYAWNAGGYAYTLHINLSHGMTRAIADRLAASIN